MDSLTPKQRLFVTAYLETLNGTQAAIRAGYSQRSAASIAERLLRNVEISQDVSAGLEKMALPKAETLARLGEIARGDIADLLAINLDGSFTLKLQVKDSRGQLVVNPKTRLIKKIKQKATTYPATDGQEERTEVVTEVELHDALAALTVIGRHHKLFSDAAIDVRIEVGAALMSALDRIYGEKDGQNENLIEHDLRADLPRPLGNGRLPHSFQGANQDRKNSIDSHPAKAPESP